MVKGVYVYDAKTSDDDFIVKLILQCINELISLINILLVQEFLNCTKRP